MFDELKKTKTKWLPWLLHLVQENKTIYNTRKSIPSFLRLAGNLKIYFISRFCEQQLLPSVVPLTSSPSAVELSFQSQEALCHQTQSVTRTWWEVMTGRSFSAQLTEKGKESCDPWLYGSIVNNPVDPWWRFVTWAFMIPRVGLIHQLANTGNVGQLILCISTMTVQLYYIRSNDYLLCERGRW